jgi:hypothetical protein
MHTKLSTGEALEYEIESKQAQVDRELRERVAQATALQKAQRVEIPGAEPQPGETVDPRALNYLVQRSREANIEERDRRNRESRERQAAENRKASAERTKETLVSTEKRAAEQRKTTLEAANIRSQPKQPQVTDAVTLRQLEQAELALDKRRRELGALLGPKGKPTTGTVTIRDEKGTYTAVDMTPQLRLALMREYQVATEHVEDIRRKKVLLRGGTVPASGAAPQTDPLGIR